jgi:hypothetical protein
MLALKAACKEKINLEVLKNLKIRSSKNGYNAN